MRREESFRFALFDLYMYYFPGGMERNNEMEQSTSNEKTYIRCESARDNTSIFLLFFIFLVRVWA